MKTIQQKRAEATIRIAARQAAEAEQAQRSMHLKRMRLDGQYQVLLVKAGMPMVRAGGNGLDTLREDVFDAASNTNGRAGVSGICETYASAMMGGEPFAVWN